MKRILAIILVLSQIDTKAEVSLHSLFTSNMILQRNVEVPIWGTSTVDEAVTVTYMGETFSTNSKSGKWKIVLPPNKAGGPYQIEIKSSNTIVLENVMIGDVWICAGQSNMDFPMKAFASNDEKRLKRRQKNWSNYNIDSINTIYTRDIETAGNTNIRLLNVKIYQGEDAKVAHQNTELRLHAKTWQESTPQSVRSFSAVGYYFGTKLEENIGIPIGLIDSNKGGSRIELWMPNDNKNFYNGMIKPLQQFPVRGVIWYQGEANTKRVRDAEGYASQLSDLIASWRSGWANPDMEFAVVQLPGFKEVKPDTAFRYWPILRESQYLSTMKTSHTTIINTIDLGMKKDIHPPFKQLVGARLANEVSRSFYSKKFDQFPVYNKAKIKDDKIVISINNVGTKLVAQSKYLDGVALNRDEIYGFTICGKDKVFKKATARFVGKDKIQIWSPDISAPVAVRYAWDNFPSCNIYSSGELPLVPFRTDNFTFE